MYYFEYNCDGLIGPTHNYQGLSFGNVASNANKNSDSNPKEAARQGLAKMKQLSDLGLKQIVLPPHERPSIEALRQLGFIGSDKAVLRQAAKTAPHLLANASSASAMWTANAATICPSSDAADGKVHITPANLNDKYHRAIELTQTSRILKATFKDNNHFVHHQGLPQVAQFGDEGAANHSRFCSDYSDLGLQLFVYGRDGFDLSQPAPQKFPARHTLQASEAVARLHQLSQDNTLFVQQNPAVIDAGVFHNDVIGVGNRNLYLYHQDAYLNADAMLERLHNYFAGKPFYAIEVSRDDVSLNDAINSYLFNSQIIDLSPECMAIVAPTECQTNPSVKAFFERLITMDNPIKEIIYRDLHQSMRNGGGPACLRLRVVLNEQEEKGVNQASILTPALFDTLDDWIDRHYRESLSAKDLGDEALLDEVRTALDELTGILQVGSIYPFQLE